MVLLENGYIGSDSLEHGLVDTAAGTGNAAGERELNIRVVELLGVGALAVGGLDGGGLNDLDAAVTDAMARAHFLVELFNCAVEGGVTVFLVGVCCASSGIVTDPNAKVFDGGGVALEDFVDCQDLAVSLFDTTELSQEIPELGLGLDIIPSPELHAVNLGVGISFGGQMTSHNLELAVIILQKVNKEER